MTYGEIDSQLRQRMLSQDRETLDNEPDIFRDVIVPLGQFGLAQLRRLKAKMQLERQVANPKTILFDKTKPKDTSSALPTFREYSLQPLGDAPSRSARINDAGWRHAMQGPQSRR